MNILSTSERYRWLRIVIKESITLWQVYEGMRAEDGPSYLGEFASIEAAQIAAEEFRGHPLKWRAIDG